jgi:hypothetical protein
MPYIRRDADGRIDGLLRDAPTPAAEHLSPDHPEVTSFLGQADSGFGRLDADFVRVIEDVIDTLIARNIINITDLPDQAQAKLFARKSFRERAVRNALALFDDSNDAPPLIDDTQIGGLR